jgi:ABC-2 type transport system permease protein
MKPVLTLIRGVAHKKLVLLVRYPVNTLSQFLGIFLFFVLIFIGGQAVIGPDLGGSLDGVIVGFFLFTMAIVAYADLSWNVTREAQWGTLEQLHMSPFGFGPVMIVKTAINVVYSFLWGGAILALMLLTTGRSLSIDLLTIVPVGILALASVVGIGFVFAGLALLYKRIENVFQLVQFALIGLIAAPTTGIDWVSLLPIVMGSDLLYQAMEGGIRLWEFSGVELAVLCLTAIGYFALGYLVFHRAQIRARRKGLMGQY